MYKENEITAKILSDEAWNVKTFQIHDYYEVNLALMDAGTFFLEGCVYQLRRGTLFCISSTLLHRNVSTDMGYERCVLKFMPHTIEKYNTKETDLLAGFHIPEPVLQLSENEITELMALIAPLLGAPDESEYGSDVLRQTQLVNILIFLNRLALGSARNTSQSSAAWVGSISPLLKYINDNIAEPLSLDDLSRHFFISKSHLCNMFKKSIGMTVNDYITHRRVLIAKQGMDSDWSLLEICGRCGFNSYTNFARCFKKVTGLAPKEYRLKLKQDHRK